jgi:hypothetical protein
MSLRVLESGKLIVGHMIMWVFAIIDFDHRLGFIQQFQAIRAEVA